MWFIFGGRLPQTRRVFSTVLLKSVAVCLYPSHTSIHIMAYLMNIGHELLGVEGLCERSFKQIFLEKKTKMSDENSLDKIIKIKFP